LVQIGNPTWLPGPIMCSDWLKLWKSSCQKLLSRWNCNIIEMMSGWSSTKCVIFVPIAYPRWPSQGNNSLPLDPMGISFKDLFFRNYLTNWIFCIMWMFLGWFYTWSIILVQIGNPTCLPGPIMCSNWLKLWRSSCQKLLSPWNCYIIEMMTGWSSAKFVIFLPIAYPVLPWEILILTCKTKTFGFQNLWSTHSVVSKLCLKSQENMNLCWLKSF
jgi:hypothetical protein